MQRQTEHGTQQIVQKQREQAQLRNSSAQQNAAQSGEGGTQQHTVQRRPNPARQNAQPRRRNNSSRKNSGVKILLWIILVLQIIVAVELFALMKVLAANEQYAYKLDGTALAGTVGNQNAAGNQNIFGKNQNSADEDALNGANNGVSSMSNTKVTSENDAQEDWKLVLVNKWNEMDPDYVPELKEVAEGHMVDSRIADALTDMIGGAKDAGYYIYILSSYRDMDKQTYLFEAEVEEWLALGYSQSGAERKAATVVASPGTSEHHLGLAVDLVDSTHVALDEGAEKTAGYQWLVKHCHEYGFILRYPNGATEITGIIYEPWHFRYVGKEAAAEIMERGITLEEYLDDS